MKYFIFFSSLPSFFFLHFFSFIFALYIPAPEGEALIFLLSFLLPFLPLSFLLSLPIHMFTTPITPCDLVKKEG